MSIIRPDAKDSLKVLWRYIGRRRRRQALFDREHRGVVPRDRRAVRGVHASGVKQRRVKAAGHERRRRDGGGVRVARGRRVCVFGVGRRGAHGAGAKNRGDALGRVGDGRRPERARRRVRFRVDERGRHGAARVAQEHVRVFLRETGGGGCGFDVRRDFEIASRRRVWRAAAPAGRAVG